jgi:hypothetical protein
VKGANHEHNNNESEKTKKMVSTATTLARSDARFKYLDLQLRQQLESDLQSRPAARKRVVLTMNTIAAPKLIPEVPGYGTLQRHMRVALRAQHPEWINPNGDSPTCDLYESRLAHVLSLSSAAEPWPTTKNARRFAIAGESAVPVRETVSSRTRP